MPAPQPFAARTVHAAEQERFAALSGDCNPMHMDPVAARRTQAGLPVVHGIHTLLWALEEAVMAGHLSLPAGRALRVRARFLKWIYLDDVATLTLTPGDEDSGLSLVVDVLGMQVLTVDLTSVDAPAAPENELPPSPPAPLINALDLSFAELTGRTGAAYTAPSSAATLMFPTLSVVLGGRAIAELAACSYVVGMEAPGLHSMFSKLDVTVTPRSGADAPHTALPYRVTYGDERFRKARVAVAGGAVAGTLEVFLRVPPVAQASMAQVAERVATGRFAGMRVLIVGGSRGLGELTAKIIAAGGGHTTLTYALGKSEAEAVANQIEAAGGSAGLLPYDVRLAPGPQLASVAEPFTHMFYFATNAIFRPKGGLLSPPILAEFSAFYLQGFYDLVVELTRPGAPTALPTGRLIVYYPSSSALDLRPEGMTEYTMVKAAGEVLCQDMNRYLNESIDPNRPVLHIHTTRLPRLPTDQTAGVLPGKDLAPIDVMLPIVEEMHRLAQA